MFGIQRAGAATHVCNGPNQVCCACLVIYNGRTVRTFLHAFMFANFYAQICSTYKLYCTASAAAVAM